MSERPRTQVPLDNFLPAKQETFPFEREFRVRILSCMVSSLEFLRRFHGLIRVELFEDPFEQEICLQILAFFNLHQNVPSEEELLEGIKEAHPNLEVDRMILLKGLLQNTFSKGISTVDFVASKIMKWMQTQEFKRAFFDSLSFLQKGEFEKIKSRMEKAYIAGMDILDKGFPYFAMDVSRLHQKGVEKIPTGINGLDRCTSGGLGRGELGVVLAPPNRGKSLFMVNLGAAAIAWGCRVVHFTLELSTLKVARRYDANFLRVPYNDVPKHLSRLAKFLMVARRMVGNNLMIKEYPNNACSVDDIKMYLEQLIVVSGFFPDLVIVDYADIMRSLTTYTEKRHAQGAIYEELRRLACEWDIPVWTGSQANRTSLSKKTITMADVAESFDKAFISDLIVALCQTPDEKQGGKMRAFVAKSRDNISQVTIPMDIDSSRMTVRDSVLTP